MIEERTSLSCITVMHSGDAVHHANAITDGTVSVSATPMPMALLEAILHVLFSLRLAGQAFNG